MSITFDDIQFNEELRGMFLVSPFPSLEPATRSFTLSNEELEVNLLVDRKESIIIVTSLVYKKTRLTESKFLSFKSVEKLVEYIITLEKEND